MVKLNEKGEGTLWDAYLRGHASNSKQSWKQSQPISILNASHREMQLYIYLPFVISISYPIGLKLGLVRL